MEPDEQVPPTPFEVHPSGGFLHGTRAELAAGEGRERFYLAEPTEEVEDDPNVTDKKFPGNPTRSLRTREPVRVVGELLDWTGHTAAQQQAMRDGLADLRRRGAAVVLD